MSDLEQEEVEFYSIAESQEESQESKSSRKRKAYSIEKKLNAVDYARKYSKHSAAKKFNVGRSLLQAWVKQENDLREQQQAFVL